MTQTERQEIEQKLTDAIPEADRGYIMSALFAGPVQPAVIDDMDAIVPEDGIKPYGQLTGMEKIIEDSFFRMPGLVSLPARIMHSRWLTESLKARKGLPGANAFGALRADESNSAALEIAVLAMALREACGETGLKAIVDDLIFGQPRYAVFRNSAEKILEEYVF